jgi:hypothetical protein
LAAARDADTALRETVIGVLESKRDFGSSAMEARILRPLLWFGLLESRTEPKSSTDVVDRRLYRRAPLFDCFVIAPPLLTDLILPSERGQDIAKLADLLTDQACHRFFAMFAPPFLIPVQRVECKQDPHFAIVQARIEYHFVWAFCKTSQQRSKSSLSVTPHRLSLNCLRSGTVQPVG